MGKDGLFRAAIATSLFYLGKEVTPLTPENRTLIAAIAREGGVSQEEIAGLFVYAQERLLGVPDTEAQLSLLHA